MNRPVRRPHVLTKAYLNAWADDRRTVDVIDKRRNHGAPMSINNATVVGGAYDSLVLTQDLEGDFAKIEDGGIRVIAKLRREVEVTPGEAKTMVAFLDMALDRGRYADQAESFLLGTVFMVDGSVLDTDFSVADRLRLAQSLPDVLRLVSMGLHGWEWRVETHYSRLVTGDGAVLLFHEPGSDELATVAFPLSPMHLLVIGKPLPHDEPLNNHIARASRRWIVGARGTLRMGDLTARVT
jgi:hypothetical protein